MRIGLTDFDIPTSQLQNQRYFQGVYCMYCSTTNYAKSMIYNVAMLNEKMMSCSGSINSLEIILILQLAHNDVKLDPACAH